MTTPAKSEIEKYICGTRENDPVVEYIKADMINFIISSGSIRRLYEDD